MVCISNEGTVVATIRDTICQGSNKRTGDIRLEPSMPVRSVFETIENDFQYDAAGIELVIQNSRGKTVILNQHLQKTLGEIGLTFDQSVRNFIIINSVRHAKPTTMNLHLNDQQDDDLDLGASASPTAGAEASHKNDDVERCSYVGLVNQAMTCYLNSLLQALYMTPEFRNALYKWEFDGVNDDKSIPYQLQRLFLNLQTSARSAVETTELTRSFGWDLSEAWQQHDVQELCRVMFDALEQKFKNTAQANFINDLYEGKMLDYVKCLECGTEKSREDTFLDVPLPVRPFGGGAAYGSVEEALRAFVQPETLDDSNRYYCEKCNKKCDAHKGFKFTKFPYVLTLHLKRFDFDYSTMHRIKLNDKVTFPEALDLNSFVNLEGASDDAETGGVGKNDDCSTADSGSALDDDAGCRQFNDGTSGVAAGGDATAACQDVVDDEAGQFQGIDVGDQSDAKMPSSTGPYKYELFSIMIHSGSASGGHYYAYIKDFRKDRWFCFNDQLVSRITDDDIRKSYGGGPLRVYYSGAYSSSTNAYMLMYRQVDVERNCSCMSVEEFPPHIKRLLIEMREREEHERAFKERQNDMFIIVYYWNRALNQLVDKTIYVMPDTTLNEATLLARHRFQLDESVDPADCRLVTYDKSQDYVGCSFEGSSPSLTFDDISGMVSGWADWMFEVKQPGAEFPVYKPGGVSVKVFLVNMRVVDQLDGPYGVHINLGDSVREIKRKVAAMLQMALEPMELVLESCKTDELQYLDNDEDVLSIEANAAGYKLYVAERLDDLPVKPFCVSRLRRVIECFLHVISVEIALPETNSFTLDSMSIPPLDVNQNAADKTSGDQSEDSSLSDSDRTLVGDAPGEDERPSAVVGESNSPPSDQHMSSPIEDEPPAVVVVAEETSMNWDDYSTNVVPAALHFRMVSCVPRYDTVGATTTAASACVVQVDRRMTLAKLKKHLEPIVGVSSEFFKVFKLSPYETEWSKPNGSLHWAKDNEKLTVRLGRVLKPDEFAGKVFSLTIDAPDPVCFLFEWFLAKGQTVAQAKRDIVQAAKNRRGYNVPVNRTRLRDKDWKLPGKVYLDDQKFGDDIALAPNWELYLQELAEPERVTNINQMCLFARRWRPSTLTLSTFHEIILNHRTMDELKTKLSEASGIPMEHVEVAAVKRQFPGDMHVLEIQGDLEWNPNVPLLESWPVQVYSDGKIFLYRDEREKAKEISPDEQNEINVRESVRLGKRSTPKAAATATTYSNKKERALKIYLDSPPKKTYDYEI